MFEGNWNYNHNATHMFAQDITAQYIRVLPLAFVSYPFLRLEILGCKGELQIV